MMPVEACRGRRLRASLQAARNQPRVVFYGGDPEPGRVQSEGGNGTKPQSKKNPERFGVPSIPTNCEDFIRRRDGETETSAPTLHGNAQT
ncbi:hypothetical protein EYF80_045355 [Liparis tanakae]|uniref:Uncharacterized protein n=1 Tax=Liparis tanakae TaxID=230148 RepID=A0A4Z2FT85_9TELE|nr:hypothetical protein EYF80_045355 [Liparis tanakae]